MNDISKIWWNQRHLAPIRKTRINPRRSINATPPITNCIKIGLYFISNLDEKQRKLYYNLASNRLSDAEQIWRRYGIGFKVYGINDLNTTPTLTSLVCDKYPSDDMYRAMTNILTYNLYDQSYDYSINVLISTARFTGSNPNGVTLGCTYIKRGINANGRRYIFIFLNTDALHPQNKWILAHEIGHALFFDNSLDPSDPKTLYFHSNNPLNLMYGGKLTAKRPILNKTQVSIAKSSLFVGEC